MLVEINPQRDQSRKQITQGIISKILTKSKNHPHGVLVQLESGEKGRVKRILKKSTEHKPIPSNKPSASLEGMISQGENQYIEFKSGALWSSRLTHEDIKQYKPQSKELHIYGKTASKVIISKTLSGFLNSNGGTLIIGIKENKNTNNDEIIGIESEFKYLKDACVDGYRRMIIDVINDYFPKYVFNHLEDYITINFETIKGKIICSISTSKSDKKIFLKLHSLDHFFIRVDASTREIKGSELVEYCEKRFN